MGYQDHNIKLTDENIKLILTDVPMVPHKAIFS
jgi:hypothetical protein